MSSFCQLTQHPITKKWHYAFWLDDYFGLHRYGVVFPHSNRDDVYDPILYKLATKKRYGGLAKFKKFFGGIKP